MVYALYCLCIVSINFHNGVNDLMVSANESIFSPFVRQMTHKNAQKCTWMLIKMQKSLLNLLYAQMIVFSSLMNVTSSNCSPFHANGAHFLVMNSKRWTCPNLLFNLLSDSVLMCSNKCKIIHSKKDEIRRSLAQSTGQLQNIRWFNI